MYATHWLIYRDFRFNRITKPFSSLEGMEDWIEENKESITVIAKTKTIEKDIDDEINKHLVR